MNKLVRLFIVGKERVGDEKRTTPLSRRRYYRQLSFLWLFAGLWVGLLVASLLLFSRMNLVLKIVAMLVLVAFVPQPGLLFRSYDSHVRIRERPRAEE